MERLAPSGGLPLIRVLTAPEPQARAAWRQWRAQADIDGLDPE
jgi:hypothetical protein